MRFLQQRHLLPQSDQRVPRRQRHRRLSRYRNRADRAPPCPDRGPFIHISMMAARLPPHVQKWTMAGEGFMADLPAREAMEFDVVVVGAGPAGLAAAIRLKQINPEISVVVVEKGSEVGAHILSGAVIDPIAIDRLLPGWRDEDSPIKTKVSADRFYYLTASNALRLPNILMPPLMSNHGNFIVSLGEVCRFLGQKAESLGVEIYPGFAAAEVLFDAYGSVDSAAT